MIDYEVGGVAGLISGLRTPTRERVVCRAVTPRKKPPEEAVTPKESPLARVKAPKIAFTPEVDRSRVDPESRSVGCFDSPKSVPKKRQVKLTNNFQFLSQISDNESDHSSTRSNKKSKNSVDVDEFVREYYEDKHGNRTVIKGGKTEETVAIQVNEKSKKKKDRKNIPSSDVTEEINIPIKSKSKRKHEVEVEIENDEGYTNSVSKKKSKKRNFEPEEDLTETNALSSTIEDSPKRKKTKAKNKHTNEDFSSCHEDMQIEHEDSTIEKRKKKSKLNKTSKEIENASQSEIEIQEQDLPNNEMEDGEDELTEFQKAAQRRIDLKAKRDLKFEPDEVKRTIFIGNIPISVIKGKYKKIFKNMFSKYGDIESFRVRNVPVEDLKTRPKVAFIEKKFHPERSTASIYLKFIEESSAQKALAENNTFLEGNHIRVDSCDTKNHQADSRKTLFLGNLPFNIEEEVIRTLFENCGPIKSVRLVRDRKTQIGKGFGFVNFEKVDGVEFALMMSEDDLKINGKVIRIKRYNTHSNNNERFRPDNTPSDARKSKNNYSEMRKLNSKKRDIHGNKIRKRDTLGESKKVKIKSADNTLAKSETDGQNVESSNNNVENQSNSRAEYFKGLTAKKKKKNKINKGVIKKKKISKILLQK